MINLLMILGILLLFIGLPVSIVTTIVFAAKKKKVKIPVLCIPATAVLSFVCLVVGASLYSKTDEYKQSMSEKQAKLEEENAQLQSQINELKKNNTEADAHTEIQTESVEADSNVTEIETEQKSLNIEPASTESEETENLEETTQSVEIESESNTEKESNVDDLEDIFLSNLKSNLDENVAEKAYDILKNQIGFSNLEYKGKMEGLTNYEIKADGYDIVLTASDDVYRIFIPSSSYVFYEDEEVKLTYEELESKTIDQRDRNIYYIMAEDIVRGGLKNPNSAKFPSIVTHSGDIAMQRNGNIVAVQSYVDAKNDFGAKVRNDWVVEFEVVDMDTYSYNLIYANIGGQEYGKFIELE